MREFASGEFGVEEDAIGTDFECAAAGGDEFERADALLEGEDFFRQTDGFTFVVSGGAVLNADLNSHGQRVAQRGRNVKG